MVNSFSIVLTKVFVNGFYRKHAGMFCFVLYILFGVVEPGQVLSYHQALMVSFISSPLILCIGLIAWLIYTLKSWHYITGQLDEASQTFLFYSSTSISKKKQLRNWGFTQFWILLPIIIYALIAIIYGVYLHLYLAPFLIVLYLLILIVLSAYFHTYHLSRGINKGFPIFKNIKYKGQKYFFSLFLYHILEKNKLSYLMIKVASWFALTGTLYFFNDVKSGYKLAGIIVLIIVMIHSFLIIQEQEFTEVKLNFSRNLPYSRLWLYFNSIQLYILILLPETIALFFKFPFVTAIEVWILLISLILLFRSLLYYTKQNRENYMKFIFGLFVVSSLIIMFNLMWFLIALNLLGSFGIFYFRYHHYERDIDPS
jgi:hypothetical protein